MKRFIVALLVLFALPLPSFAATTLTSGIVAYYAYTAGNGTDSVNAYTSSASGSVTFGAPYGKLGPGIFVTSNTGYMDLPSQVYSLFSSTNAWSVSLWGSFPGLASAGHLFGVNTNGSYQCYGANLNANADGSVTGYHGNCTNTETIFNTNTGVISSSGWYHIVLTFDGGSTYKIYVNAVDKQTASGRSYTSSTMTKGQVGVSIYSGGTEGGGDRYIDEVAFWNRALSQAEVTELYNTGVGIAYPFVVSTISIYTLMMQGF